jgi:branched-chain amino acid transport system permease protein
MTTRGMTIRGITKPGMTAPRLAILLLALATLGLPLVLPQYDLRVMILALIAALSVIGLCIAFGWAGLIQLGQAAFVGVGAYTSAIVSCQYGFPFPAALLAATAVSGLLAVLIGVPLLRLRGHYLALATVGLNATAIIIISNAGDLTGGYDGYSAIPPAALFGVSFTTDTQYFYLTWTILAAISLGVAGLRHSRFGRALLAIRDDELAAGTSGVPVVRMKVLAYGLCGACGGISGSLYAHYANYISPGDFDLVHSITFLVMLIVGGETSIIGAILGAILLSFLPEWLRFLGGSYLAVFGVGVLLVLVLMPTGIVGLASRLAPRRREPARA